MNSKQIYEAFPNQSPYSYSFNNPLSYRDPSGLAPEKEKGGGMRIQSDKTPEEIMQEAMNQQYIEALTNEWSALTAAFTRLVQAANDQADGYINYIFLMCFGGGGSSGGSSGSSGTSGEGSDGRVGRTESDNGTGKSGRDGIQKQVKEKTGDATDEYLNDPNESTVLDDIPADARRKSWDQVEEQQANTKAEAGGKIFRKDKNTAFPYPAIMGDENSCKINLNSPDQNTEFPSDWWMYDVNSPLASYHGHSLDPTCAQTPNYTDWNTFNNEMSNIQYHMTYITTFPQRVYVWDNKAKKGYIFSVERWRR